MKSFQLTSLLIIFLCSSLCAFAQDADNIMKTASAKFKSHKSVESNYTITYTEGSKKRRATGGIIMQKNKYVNLIEGNKTWFNGKTMWTYVKDNEEVNVTEPSANDMLSNNPYFFINSYSQEYNASLQNSGGRTYDIKLTPKKTNEDVKYVILRLLKDSYQPVSLSIFMKNSQMDIVLNSFKTGKSYKNSSFAFDKKKYPEVDIIDLR